jgi:hypothetical protein
MPWRRTVELEKKSTYFSRDYTNEIYLFQDRHRDTDNVHDTEDTARKITQDSENFINFNLL